MMKSVILLFFAASSMLLNAQVLEEGAELRSDNEELNSASTFELYPTSNAWNFIKLNSRNGLIWQVQFDVGDENRFENILNVIPLVDTQEEFNGRFKLHPTQNIWTFLLIDRHDGRVWQVQWSLKPENWGIIPIK